LAKRPSSVTEGEGDLGSVYERDKKEVSYFPFIAYPPVVGDDVTSTMRLLVFLLSARRILGLKENQKIDLLPYIKQWDKIDWDAVLESAEMPDIPVPDGFDLNFQMKEFLKQPSGPDVINESKPQR